MAQKINPYFWRLGYNQKWKSYYFASQNQEEIKLLKEHKLIREKLFKEFSGATKIVIEQTENKLFIKVSTTDAQLFIDEKKGNLDEITKKISDIIKDGKIRIKLHLDEVKNIYENSQAITNFLARQISVRAPFRITCKKMIEKVDYEENIKGVKIIISGRLDGNEIARTESFKKGKISTSKINEKIDFGRANAKTKYGIIGIDVLLCKKFTESNPSKNPVFNKQKKYNRGFFNNNSKPSNLNHLKVW